MLQQGPSKGASVRISLLHRSIVLAALLSLTLAGVASALEVGQKAPDFSLNGIDGKPVKLSDLTAKGPVVIYTFIAAFTPT
jgi:peroxiredoxin Q/BCP